MHIDCTQENLARALQVVSRMVGVRGTLPVLGNILLTIEKGRLKLAATDLEIGVQTWIGGKVYTEGSLTVPARLFVEFVNTNTDATITLRQEETTLHLTSPHYTARIKGIDATEFPLIPTLKQTGGLTLPARELKEAIQQTVFATALDETRPILTGVLVKIEKSTLKLVATDSYRLAERTLKLSGNHSPIQVIIPARTLQELARMLPDQDVPVQLFLAENQVLFTFSETEFISRLIDGTFPDYQQIIPPQPTTTVTIPKVQFIQVMKMASFFARESANNVQLKVQATRLEVTAVSPQLGDTVSQLEASVDGEDVEIAFNAKFLLDALLIFPGSTVTLSLSGKLQAGILRPVDQPDYLYLLMPLRIEA